MEFDYDLPPDALTEITSLLARGFLRYRKSQRMRPVNGATNGLDSPAVQSRHVTVVDATEKDEN